MLFTTPRPCNSTRADRSHNPDRCDRANFARAAVFSEFGRYAWALDQDDFEDRKSWERPARSPEARPK